MKIALFGPSSLSEFERREICDYVDRLLAKKNEIALLFYHSIELLVIKRFIEKVPSEEFHRLSLYSIQNFNELNENEQKYIKFLVSYGASYTSFEIESELTSKRSIFISAWQKILDDCDGVTTFYDGEKFNLLIPVDEAKKINKQHATFHLSGNSFERFSKEWHKKIKTS